MADFRKWLIAFAAVALLLSLGSTSAYAQTNNPAFVCNANAGVPPLVRSEGVTELVGDLILNCTGGTPTAVGVPIPQSNIQVFLNTNLTSRLYAGNISEALLLIDEPFASGNVGGNNPPTVAPAGFATTTFGCIAENSTNCLMLGTGGGFGVGGPYSGTGAGHYNLFQGIQPFPTTSGINTVEWLGVPIDAPGTTVTRVIRITNVRANACLLGAGSSLIPTPITMFIAVNGSQQVTINNPSQTVAAIRQGLLGSVQTAGSFVQCNNINGVLLGVSPNGQTGTAVLTATEGFASSFKVRNYAQIQQGSPGAPKNDATLNFQNVVGFPYNTESGYVTNDPGPITAAGLQNGDIGLADTGTEISFTFTNIGTGINLFVPLSIPLISTVDNTTQTGVAVLIGGAVQVGSTGLAAVSLTSNAGAAVYEVQYDNPNVVESATLEVTLAAIANEATNSPAIGKGNVSINFAPLASSTNQTASAGPIPRFCQPYPSQVFFAINACTCNLLFPFVTQQNGFDTGVAIANTSMDPFGTSTQHGTVVLNYYGNTSGGGAAPAPQTSTDVAAGDELVFSLFGGDASGHGLTPTPGFQGYIIATANFQYCHGFAFISDLGAQKLAEGYLAIELDEPFNLIPGFTRTGVGGEVQAH